MGDLGNLPNGVGMLGPFDTLYEQPKPRFIFKMPRVVPDQKHKFEKDALFRRLSRESEVSYNYLVLNIDSWLFLCVVKTKHRKFDC